MYLHKCKLKSLKKRYQEKLEDAYLAFENATPFSVYSLLARLIGNYIGKISENYPGHPPQPNPDLLLHVFTALFVTSGLEVLFHHVARWRYATATVVFL